MFFVGDRVYLVRREANWRAQRQEGGSMTGARIIFISAANIAGVK
jgi:hypothetical protein